MTSSTPTESVPFDPNSAPPPQVLAVRVVHKGWGRFLLARLRLADGQEIDREIEDHGAAVAVLPYDPDRRIALLVRQLRPPAFYASGQVDMLEVPAGCLDSDNPQACAIREVWEETGIGLTKLEPVCTAWPMPSVSTETLHLFLAEFSDRDRTGPGGGLASEGEQITIETIPLGRLAAMADRGDLVDMKTLVLLLTLRHRRPDLFAGSHRDTG